ncbi:hypothetical protein [Cellulomonas marina]|uniref:Uncharacterized protein n=1 Tax=Cellulomonas marina TaxID=988821 RepID=A0A1I1AVZ7_9CELL|nr:hypothetical protein [Cellulomonas marina]GIG29243.1 hypothetical protein Cma02nite_18430 [Cellulomonas marina]SFB42211.1 hypothetical protein SAMN05421867_1253 [Cellulomonas marina]
MLAQATAGPDWFDWLTLVVTVLAAVVPAWLAIALWRSDRRAGIRERRSAAIREFTHLLATGDPVLVRFRDMSHFAAAMGPGSAALLDMIWRFIEWDHDDIRSLEVHPRRRGIESPPPTVEPRIDLSVDVNDAISRWNQDPQYRADLTEVYLANGHVFPAEEDNRIISPATRRAAEREVLKDARAYREWLAGTRLSPRRVRLRRLFGWLRFWAGAPAEPLNPLATKDFLEEDDLADDAWLRARTTAPLAVDDEE